MQTFITLILMLTSMTLLAGERVNMDPALLDKVYRELSDFLSQPKDKSNKRSVGVWVAKAKTAALEPSTTLERCVQVLPEFPKAEAIFYEAEALSNQINQKLVRLGKRSPEELSQLFDEIKAQVARLEELRTQLIAEFPEKFHKIDRVLTVMWELPMHTERDLVGSLGIEEAFAELPSPFNKERPQLSRIRLRPITELSSPFSKQDIEKFQKDVTQTIYTTDPARESLEGFVAPPDAQWRMKGNSLLLTQRQSLADSCLQNFTFPTWALIERSVPSKQGGYSDTSKKRYETGPVFLSYWATSERIEAPKPQPVMRHRTKSTEPIIHEW